EALCRGVMPALLLRWPARNTPTHPASGAGRRQGRAEVIPWRARLAPLRERLSAPPPRRLPPRDPVPPLLTPPRLAMSAAPPHPPAAVSLGARGGRTQDEARRFA